MTGGRALIALECRGARQVVALDDFVDAGVREHAVVEANRWIKGLRLARIDGTSLRDRFHYRGDSLWWFTELYLHKEARVVAWLEGIRAVERCLDAHGPDRVSLVEGTRAQALLIERVAEARQIAVGSAARLAAGRGDALRCEARAQFYTWSAHLSRLRSRPTMGTRARGGVAAFVHSAFWRRGSASAGATGAGPPGGEGEEGYIGTVLEAVRATGGDRALTLVGVGPRVNFRARTWWHGMATGEQDARLPFAPVEAFADRRAIAPSLAVWRRRHRDRRALLSSADVRAAARVGGCDVWPLVAAQLKGVVDLQWPWSARAMDEAGAALDALAPDAVLTYAEAGGWGRAIVLEARRRGIPSVGLQHGFIYRHWLNYLHEADEMEPSAAVSTDVGFPRPTRTLVFDRYAEEHLRSAGRFPADALEITGNPRLDALVVGAARLSPVDRQAVRRSIGAGPDDHVVVVAAKYTQIRRVFRAVAEAAAGMPSVRLVVKCHPAETPDPYLRDVKGLSRVEVVEAAADLAGLIAVARGLVTVNSTVAIDALVLGVPALVVDLPSNLSPFVERGVMLGAPTPDAVAPRLADLVDGPAREDVLNRGRRFLAEYQIQADGGAAARAARSVRHLAAEALPGQA